MEKQTIQRILIIASGLVFVGIMVFPMAGLFNNSTQPSNPNANQQKPVIPPEVKKQLEGQVKGYEEVLKREPKNTSALVGLAKAQLQLQNWQASLVPLEKLSVIYPNQTEIWKAIAQTKIKLGDLNGAIAATEKLVKLEPKNQEYQNVLKLLKQQATGNNPGTNQKSPK